MKGKEIRSIYFFDRNYFFVFCLLFSLFFTRLTSHAQVSINTIGTAVTQNFNGMPVNSLNIPAPFKISADNTTNLTNYNTGLTVVTRVAGTLGVNALNGTSAGAAYHFASGDSATSTDRSIGFLTSIPYPSPRSILYAFTNNTGSAIATLTISWNYEKYRSGTRAFNWTFFHGSTSTPAISALAGDHSYAADANNLALNPPSSVSKNIVLNGLNIPDGATYYLRWTLTGVGGSSNAQATGIDNFSITLSDPISSTPAVNVTSANPAVAAGTLPSGSGNNLIYAATAIVSNAAATLNSVSFTTTGTFTAADALVIKLWRSSSSTFDPVAAAPAIGTITASGAGTLNYNFSPAISLSTGTHYFYLTADVPCAATGGNTIQVSAPVAGNFSFTGLTPTASTFAGGIKTIAVDAPSQVTAATASGGNAFIQTGWTNPTTCFDEIVIFATTFASFSGTPSGNGSLYNASTVYTSGTILGNAYCIYKGSTSPVTITNLINGTVYNIAIYTRRGTVWSSPVLLSATPFSGVNGDYRSRASGSWDLPATWDKMVGGVWIASPDFPSDIATTVTVQNSHTVQVVSSLRNVKNLVVNFNGKVFTNTVNISNKYLNVYGNIVCNGTIGNGVTLDDLGFNIEGVNDTISGTGSISIIRIRKNTATNATTNLVINADMRLYWVSAAGTGSLYNACTTAANQFNVTLKSGKTITTDGVICIDGTNGQQTGADAYGTFTIEGTLNVGQLYFTCNNAAFSPNFVIGSTGVVNAVNVAMPQSAGAVPHILTINAGGRLNITGTAGITPFSAVNNTYNFASGSIVEYSAAGNQPVQTGLPYSNLIISGTGIKSANGNINVETGFTLNSSVFSMTGLTVNLGGGATACFIRSNGGSLDAGAAGGTVNFVSSGSIAGSIPLTFFNLNINAGAIGLVRSIPNNCNAQTLNLVSGRFEIGILNQFNILAGGSVVATSGDFAVGTAGGILNFPGTGTFTGSCSPFDVYISGGVNFGTGTVTIQSAGRLRINNGGFADTNGPFYASGSTLEYNNGAPFFIAGTEWYAGFSTGRGVPHHVQIGLNTLNGTNLVFTGGTWRQMNGNLNIGPTTGGSGYGFTLSSTVGGDLRIGGSWTRAGSTSSFNPNNRSVTFNGTAANQTITVWGTGLETFAYLIVNKPAAQNLVLQASLAPTNVTITGGASGGNSLSLLNGNIDLNGRTLNFNPYTNNFQNNLAIDGTAGSLTRNINSSLPGGVFNIYSNDASVQRVSNVVRNSANTSLLSFGTNTTLVVGGLAQNSGINFGPGYTTINGNLQINTWGYVDINAPFYGVNSNLIYNSGGAYKRFTEWSTTTGAGYPYNVIVQNNTNLRVNDDNIPVNTGGNGTADRALAGSLNILPTGVLTLGDSTENNKLTIGLDFNLDGTINMPSTTAAIGADLYIGRNWNRTSTGVYNHNERAVFFNGNLDGTITAIGGQYFPYVYLQKNALNNKLTLLDTIRIGKEFGIQSGSFDLASRDAILQSNFQSTARFGQVGATGDVLYSGSGRFIVERYLPTGTGAGQHGKSWQFLATPATGTQTIKEAWQEGATIANQNLISGYGTQITSNNGGSQTGAAALGFDVYTPAGPSMKVFNSIGVWNGVPNTNIPIYNQKGYMVFVRGDRSVTTFNAPATATTLRTRGKLFVPNSNPIPTSFIPAGKFESIGNPHASAVDFTYFDKSDYPDVDNAFYVWDPLLVGSYGLGGYQLLAGVNGDFLPSPGGTANYPPGVPCKVIQSGQVILMHSTANGGYVRIPDSAKVAGSALSFRVPAAQTPRQYLRIYLHVNNPAQTLADGLVVAFSPAFSNRYEANDAVKLFNTAENLSLQCENQTLALEARSLVVRRDTLKLLMGNMRRQDYQMRFAPEQLDPRLNLQLFDHYTQIWHNLSSSDSTYVNFTVNADPASYRTDRFIVVLSRNQQPTASTPIVALSERSMNVPQTIELTRAQEQNNISVVNPVEDKVLQMKVSVVKSGKYLLNVFDASGRLVHKEQLRLEKGLQLKKLALNQLQTGNYFISLSNAHVSIQDSFFLK